MSVLLIAEHNNQEVKPFTLNAISAASQINKDIHVLVLGSNSDSVAKSISECPNVKKVIHINNELYENYLAENYTSAVIKISEDTFLRPIYAGNAFATVKSTDKIKCVTIRPTSFDPAPTSGGSA